MEYNAQAEVALMNIHYAYELSDDEFESAKVSKEAVIFDLFSKDQLKEMWEKGKLVRDFSYIYHLLD